MSVPQIIISLSPAGELVTELPGLNGSRRKINLQASQKSNYAIAYAVQILREISNLSPDTTSVKDATKATELLNSLRSKMKSAAEAANQITNLLDEDNTTCDILLRILNGQQANKNQIGEDGSPTAQQVKHWQKHSDIWGDPSCPFCISEGKFEKGKNREDNRSLRGLTEYEALRLGLISRGYVASKNNPEIYSKKNMANIWLKTSGKVLDHKHIEWSKTHRDALILDGKIHAKKFGFTFVNPKPEKIGNGSCTVKSLKKFVKNPKVHDLSDLTI